MRVLIVTNCKDDDWRACSVIDWLLLAWRRRSSSGYFGTINLQRVVNTSCARISIRNNRACGRSGAGSDYRMLSIAIDGHRKPSCRDKARGAKVLRVACLAIITPPRHPTKCFSDFIYFICRLSFGSLCNRQWSTVLSSEFGFSILVGKFNVLDCGKSVLRTVRKSLYLVFKM